MKAVSDELLDLIRHERALILAADFDGLGRIGDLKKSLVEQLGQAGKRSEISELLIELRRNETLMSESRRGLIQARNRVRDIHRNMTQMSVYGADGHRSKIKTTDPKIRRTA